MMIIKKEYFNISNLLSLLRLFFTIPFIVLFNYWNQPGIKETIIFLTIVAALTDILDGFLARKLNQITEFGKIIDPLADKIAMTTVLLGIALNDLLPVYYIILVVSRDVLILIGGIYLAKSKRIILSSNIIGKITVIIIGNVILLTLAGIEHKDLLFITFYYLSIIMIFISLFVYTTRAIKFIRRLNESV